MPARAGLRLLAKFCRPSSTVEIEYNGIVFNVLPRYSFCNNISEVGIKNFKKYASIAQW